MPFRSKRASHLIAIVTWLASVLLPLAHGAMGLPQRGDAVGWCGESRAALATAVRALPADVRRALEAPDRQAVEKADCAVACGIALTLPGRMLSVPELPSTAVERQWVLRRAPVNLRSYTSPPVRGPPSTG